MRTYRELISLSTFQERFAYLQLSGKVGKETFGFDRYLNQLFYRSEKWRRTRNEVIMRDEGRDLAMPGFEIYGKTVIHHMNPISLLDIEQESDLLLNPEFLITTTPNTHNAIHYGDASLLPVLPKERERNDTCPWRH